MNHSETKELKVGTRVFWQGQATDGGVVTKTTWDAVTIAWDNNKTATVLRGDMREIQRNPTNPKTV